MGRKSNGMKQEAILDAAVIEIARRGYYQTTVAMIARRAGVADGTIYLYFQNKDEILFSLFDRAMDRFIAEGRIGLEGAGSALEKSASHHRTCTCAWWVRIAIWPSSPRSNCATACISWISFPAPRWASTWR